MSNKGIKKLITSLLVFTMFFSDAFRHVIKADNSTILNKGESIENTELVYDDNYSFSLVNASEYEEFGFFIVEKENLKDEQWVELSSNEGKLTQKPGQYYIAYWTYDGSRKEEILDNPVLVEIKKATIAPSSSVSLTNKVASWSNKDATHVDSYLLTLSKDGKVVEENILSINTSLNLSNYINDYGYGEYAYTVTALTNNSDYYNDSIRVSSNSYVYKDEILPVIDSFEADSTNNQLVASGHDENSEIVAYGFSTDKNNIDWITTSDASSFSYAAEKEGNYYFFIKDSFGNVNQSEKTVTVNKVTINYNDKSSNTKEIYLVENAKYTLEQNITNPGYVFAGWTLNNQNVSEVVSSSTNEEYIVEANWVLEDVEGFLSTPSNYTNEYDGYTHKLIYTFSLDDSDLVSYKWFKDGKELVGANSLAIEVKDVKDSGEYYLEATVTRGTDTQTFTSDTVTVEITKATLDLSIDSFTVGYGAKEPTLKYLLTGFKSNDSESTSVSSLVLSTDYTSTSKVGSYAIEVIEFKSDNYDYNLLAPAFITVDGKNANESVSVVYTNNTGLVYKGEPITVTVEIFDGTNKLVEGKDYSIAYDNNLDAGTANITISFMGNYSNTEDINDTFEIAKADYSDIKVSFNSENNKVEYNATNVSSLVSINEITEGNVIFNYLDSQGNILDYIPSDAGKYSVYAVVEESKNYNSYSTIDEKVSFEITPITITISSDGASKIYDGSPLSAPGYKVEGNFAGSDAFKSISVTKSITNVGKITNTIDWAFTSSTNCDNYNIELEEGELEIIAKALPTPSNLSWDNEHPGTANWVGVIREGINVVYNVDIYRNNEETSFATYTTSDNSLDLSSYILGDVFSKVNGVDRGIGSYRFTVTAVIDSNNPGVNAANYTAGAPSGSSYQINTQKVTLFSNPEDVLTFEKGSFYTISGQSVTLNITSKADGYSYKDTIWSTDNTTNISLINPDNSHATLNISNLADKAEIIVYASVDDDAPIISEYKAETFDDGVVLSFKSYDVGKIVKYAFTETNEVANDDAAWISVENPVNGEFDGSTNKLTSEVSYFVSVMDNSGNIVTSEYPLSVYKLTLLPGEAEDETNIDGIVLYKGEGNSVQLPENTFLVDGKEFVSWKGQTGSYRNEAFYNDNSSDTLVAKFSDKEYNYTVNYYYMETSGKYPTEPSNTVSYTAKYDEVISYDFSEIQISKLGFDLDLSKMPENDVVIVEDNQEIDIYYSRNTFQVVYSYFDPQANVTKKVEANYLYGQTIGNELDEPELDGYDFSGWQWLGYYNKPSVMPAQSIRINGSFTAKDAVYNINYYFKQLDGSYAINEEYTNTLVGKHNSVVTSNLAKARNIMGYTLVGVASNDNELSNQDIDVTISAVTEVDINYYYDLNTYTLTVNVYDQHKTAVLYTESYDVKYGATTFVGRDNKSHVLADIGTNEYLADGISTIENNVINTDIFELADYIDYSCGLAVTTMPAGDVVVSREYVLKNEMTYTVALYAEDANGNYNHVFTYFYFTDAIYDEAQFSTMFNNYSVRDWGTTIKDYCNYNFNSERSSYDVDSQSMKLYYSRNEVEAKITYIYLNKSGASSNIGTATIVGKWGTNFTFDPLAYFYGDFDASKYDGTGKYNKATYNTTQASDINYNDLACQISYSGSYNLNDNWYYPSKRYISLASLDDNAVTVFGRTKYVDYNGVTQTVHPTEITVYYAELDNDNHYTVDIGYRSDGLTDGKGDNSAEYLKDSSFKQLTVDFDNKTYYVRVANKADIFNSTLNGIEGFEDYKALVYLPNSLETVKPYYSYGTLKDEYSEVELANMVGKYYITNNAEADGKYYIYVLDESNQLFYGNRASFNYLTINSPDGASKTNVAGYDNVTGQLDEYKNVYADLTNVLYYSNAKAAYIHNPGYYRIVNSQARQTYVFEYWNGTLYPVTYILHGNEVKDAQRYLSGEKTDVNYADDAFSLRDGYRIVWYGDSAFSTNKKIGEKGSEFTVNDETVLYGQYEKNVFVNHGYVFYQLANDVEGLTDDNKYIDHIPSLEELEDTKWVVESVLKDKDNTTSYTNELGKEITETKDVYLVKYYYDGELVLIDDQSASVSLQSISIQNKITNGTYDLTGFKVDNSITSTVTAGYPTNDPIDFKVYYAREIYELTVDHNDQLIDTNPSTIDKYDYVVGSDIDAIELANSLEREGYKFDSWTYYVNGNEITDASDIPTKMPATNVKMVANWTPSEFDGYVVHYFSDENGEYNIAGYNDIKEASENGSLSVIYGGQLYTARKLVKDGKVVGLAIDSLEEDHPITYYITNYDPSWENEVPTMVIEDIVVVEETKKYVSEQYYDVKDQVVYRFDLIKMHYMFNYANYVFNNSVTNYTELEGNKFYAYPTMELAYFYTRNEYNVTTVAKLTDNGEEVFVTSGDGSYIFNQNVTAKVSIPQVGYSFVGWFKASDVLDDNGDVISDYDVSKALSNQTSYGFVSTSSVDLVALVKPNETQKAELEIKANYQSESSTTLTYGYSYATNNSLKAVVTLTDEETFVDSYKWYVLEDGSWKLLDTNTSTHLIETGKDVGSYQYKCVVTTKNVNNGRTATIEKLHTLEVVPATLNPIVKGYTGTYDGSSHSISVNLPTNVDTSKDEFEITYSSEPFDLDKSYQDIKGSAELSYKDVLVDDVTHQPKTRQVYYYIHSVNGNYQDTTGSGEVFITPKTLTIKTSGVFSKYYDGNDYVDGDLADDVVDDKDELSANLMGRVTGFVEGEKEDVLTGYLLDFNATYKNIQNQNTSHVDDASVIHLTDVKLVKYLENAVQINYNYRLADIAIAGEIKPKEIEVVWSESDLTYNMTAQGPTAIVKPGQSLIAQDSLTIVSGGKQTNEGTYYATATVSVESEIGSRNTDYVVSNDKQQYTIKKYEITVTAESNTLTMANGKYYITYDGQGHTLESLDYSSDYNEDDLVNVLSNITVTGVPHTYVYSAASHDIKVSKVAIYSKQGTDISDNFIISTPYSQLVITPRKVTVSGIEVDDKEYDGSTDATIKTTSEIVLSGIIDQDKVSLIANSISVKFPDKKVGKYEDTVIIEYADDVIEGNSASNYYFDVEGSQHNTTAEITAKIVYVTVDSAERIYGENNEFEVHYTGIIESGLTVEGSIVYTIGGSTFDNRLPVNNGYDVEVDVTGLSLANYKFELAQDNATTLTVVPRNVVVEGLGHITKVYDGNANASIDSSNYNFTSEENNNASGVLLDDVIDIEGYSASYDNANKGTNKKVTASGYSCTNTNYHIVNDTFELTGDITIREVEVIVKEKEITYGDNTPTTYDYEVKYNGQNDNVGKNELVVSFTTDYDKENPLKRNAGQKAYDITASVQENENYIVTITNNKLTVKPATLTIKVVNEEITYGENLPTSHDVTITGYKYEDKFDQAIKALCDYSYDSTLVINSSGYYDVGEYDLALSLQPTSGLSENYNYQSFDGKITISPLEITVVENNPITKQYDGTINANIIRNNYKFVGVLDNDTVNLMTGYTARYNDASVANGNKVTVTNCDVDNKNYSLVNKSFDIEASITKAPLLIKVNNAEIFYGKPLSMIYGEGMNKVEGNVTIGKAGKDFVNNETSSVLNTDNVVFTNNTHSITSNVGTTHVVEVTGFEADNYTIEYDSGEVKVIANKLATPEPIWSTDNIGTISFNKVDDISEVRVKHYNVDLYKDDVLVEGKSFILVREDDKDVYSINYAMDIRNLTNGKYTVKVTAIAQENNNVSDSDEGVSSDLYAAKVKVTYSSQTGGENTVNIHDNTLTEYVMIAGESDSISAKLANSTGYKVISCTSDNTISSSSTTKAISFNNNSQYDATVKTPGDSYKSDIKLSNELALSEDIEIKVALEKVKATLAIDLTVDYNETKYTYGPDGIDGYKQPQYTTSVATVNDNVDTDGYDYTYTYSLKRSASAASETLATDSSDNTIKLPTGLNVSNPKMTVVVKATRKDNGETITATKSINISVLRADVVASSNDTTWIYGESRVNPTVTSNNDDNPAPVVTYYYSKDDGATFIKGLPTERGTYKFYAALSATENYGPTDTKNSLKTITITQNKLSNPTGLVMSGMSQYGVNFGKYSWNEVKTFVNGDTAGLKENKGNNSASEVGVTYKVIYEYKSLTSSDYVPIYETTTDLLTADLANHIEGTGYYRIKVQAISSGDYSYNALDSDVVTSDDEYIVKIDGILTASEENKIYDYQDVVLTASLDPNSGVTLSNEATYLWYKNGSLVDTTDTNTLNIRNVSESGVYSVVINDGNNTYRTNFKTVTISLRDVTISANNLDKIYGETDPELTATVQLKTGDKGLIVEDGYNLSYSLSRETGENVKEGNYVITVTANEVQGNYHVLTQNGVFEILRREVTVTADDDEKTYGQADPEFKATVEGKNDTTKTGLVDDYNLVYSVSRTNSQVQDKGIYTGVLNVTGSEIQGNYKVNYVPGDFEIKQANLSNASIGILNDETYNGLSQAKEPVVTYNYLGQTKPLVKDVDYIITYSNSTLGNEVLADDTTESGTITVTIVAKENGNFVGNNYVTYRILPKELSIETYSANRPYDGIALQAGGKVIGIQNNETYGFKTTGSVTNYSTGVDNTYELVFASDDNNYSAKAYNYVIDQDNISIGTLRVDKAIIKVTTNSAAKVYDSTELTAGGSHSELPNNETIGLVTTGSVTHVIDGEVTNGYVVKFNEDDSQYSAHKENYQIVEETIGTLKINYRDVTVKVNEGQFKVYGDSNPANYLATVESRNDVTKTGYIDGPAIEYTVVRETGENVQTNYSLSITAEEYQGDYHVVVENGTFEIKAAEFSLGEIDDVTYNSNSQAITPVVYGVNGEILDNNDCTISFSDDTTNVTTVTVTVVGKHNYTGTKTVQYDILHKLVTITPFDKVMVFGANDVELTAKVEGLIGNDAVEYTLVRDLTKVDVGEYPGAITVVAQELQGNYKVVCQTGKLTIIEASGFEVETLDDVVFNGLSQKQFPEVYGVNGELLTKDKDYIIEFSNDTTNVGTVLVTVSGIGNYSGEKTVSYDITPKTVTISAIDKQKTYGDDEPELEVSIIGLVGSDTVVYTVSRDETKQDVGDYEIVVEAQASQGNYKVVTNNGVFTITHKEVRVVVDDNQSKIYGQLDPELTATIYGLPLTKSLPLIEYSIERETGEDVGEYLIDVDGQEYQGNYHVIYVDGTFEIIPLTITVKVDDGFTKVYGDDDPILTVSVTGLVNENDKIEYTISRDTTKKDVGTYVVEVTGQKLQGNYEVEYINGELTITPKEIVVKPVSGLTKTYGENDPDLTANVEGLVGEDTIEYLVNREAGEDVGSYVITIVAKENQGNYTIKSEEGLFEIVKKKPTIATEDVEVTYDGTKVFVEASTDSDGKLVYTNNGQVDVGEYVVEIMVEETDNYLSASASATIKVLPLVIEITTASASKVYDGTELTNNEFCIAEGYSLAKGDEISSITFTGSQTNVGSSENKAEGIVIVNEDGKDVTDNYVINYNFGILKVEKENVPNTGDVQIGNIISISVTSFIALALAIIKRREYVD